MRHRAKEDLISYRRCDFVEFTSTANLEKPGEFIGQGAPSAVEFGVGIRRCALSLFLLGPAGTGNAGIFGHPWKNVRLLRGWTSSAV